MIPTPLPTDFVLSKTRLTWREALWGYTHQLVDWTILRDLAIERLTPASESKSAEVQLAGLLPSECTEAEGLAQKLADAEPSLPEEAAQQKWLYLILRWVFENREQLSDPLSIAEEVFCDFGHPLEIAGFI